jgi:hypothetical protein
MSGSTCTRSSCSGLQQTAVRATACVAEAQSRGDRYTETTARLYIVPLVHLALDQPDAAEAEADAAIGIWGQGGFHHQHWAELRARCCVDLYRGQGSRAVERIEACRKAMKESLLLRIRTPRLEHTYFEGRGLLDSAWEAADPAPLLSRVDRAIARLEGEGNRLASAYSTSLRAGRIARSGDEAATRAAFAAAEAAFEAIRMPLFAAAARRRQAEVADGEAIASTAAQVDRILSAAGVVAPDRFARFLAPRAR